MRIRETQSSKRSGPAWLRAAGPGAPGNCMSVRYWDDPAGTPGPIPDPPERHPVFLVPGFGGADHRWEGLRQALAGAGFQTVIALRHNAFRADIPAIADWLVDHAMRAMSLTGSSGVHLIGHSMGGLVVRDAVQSRGLAGLATTAITIATPHHGAGLTRFLPGPAARQLSPGSDFLIGLNSRPLDPRTNWVNVMGTGDLVIHPSSGSLLDAGDRPGDASAARIEVLEQEGVGHLSIATHPRIVGRIISALIRAEITAGTALSLTGSG